MRVLLAFVAAVALAASGCVDTHTERFAIQGPWHSPGSWSNLTVPEGWTVVAGNATDLPTVARLCVDGDGSADRTWEDLCAHRHNGIGFAGLQPRPVDGGPYGPSLAQVERLLENVTAPQELDPQAIVDELSSERGIRTWMSVPDLELNPALVPDVPAEKLHASAVDCPTCRRAGPLGSWNFREDGFPVSYSGSWPYLSLSRNETLPSDTKDPILAFLHIDARDFVQVEIRHDKPGGTMTRAEFEEAAAVILHEFGITDGPHGQIQCGNTNFCGMREGSLEPLAP